MPDQPFAPIEQRLFAASRQRIRVLGLRRMGQHAVINWILRNAGPDTVFLNSCTMRRSALRSCGQSELDGQQAGNGHRLQAALDAYLTPEKHPLVLWSYEAGFDTGGLTPHTPDASFNHEVLIIRSFTNWLPSFLRLMRLMTPRASAEGLEIAHGVVFEMMRYKAHLLAAQDSPHMVISFDHWATSPQYRLEKLTDLGMMACDNALGKVQSYGGGSSFSGFDIPAENMALTARWKTMQTDPYARQFLRIAQADDVFMAALERRYPEDTARMAQLLAQT